jgi:hypothetical protein
MTRRTIHPRNLAPQKPSWNAGRARVTSAITRKKRDVQNDTR